MKSYIWTITSLLSISMISNILSLYYNHHINSTSENQGLILSIIISILLSSWGFNLLFIMYN